METFNYSDLTTADIQKLVQRNVDPANEIRTLVEDVIENVRQHGDRALIDYAHKFDKVELTKLYLDRTELQENAQAVTEDQQEALQTAYANIYKFHKAQIRPE